MVWFGFLAFFVVTAGGLTLFGGPDYWRPEAIMFLVVPALMAFFGFGFFKKLIWDLADEVFDGGSFLLVRRSGVEEKIELRNIINVSASTLAAPQRITLLLRNPSSLGKEVSFSPPMPMIPFARNSIADELIDRVDKARNS